MELEVSTDLDPLCSWAYFFLDTRRLRSNLRRGRCISKLLTPTQVLIGLC